MKEAPPLVSFISINYNQVEVTCQMLASLKKLTFTNFEIIIVDNASKENPEPIIISQFPQTTIVRSSINLGFAGGNNLGLKKAKGKYIFYINNDTEVTPHLLEPLIELFEKNPNAGMATPKIKYFNTNIIQYAGSNAINALTGRGNSFGYGQEDVGQFDFVKETQLPHGAALMVPIEVIKKVCMMPELFFLYYEEHDWAESIKKAGHKIFYVGTAEIYHKESISVGKMNPMKTFYMTRNRMLFMRRNTEGLNTIVGFLFFTFISIPKNIGYYLISRQWNHLKAFVRGVLAYLRFKYPLENVKWKT